MLLTSCVRSQSNEESVIWRINDNSEMQESPGKKARLTLTKWFVFMEVISPYESFFQKNFQNSKDVLICSFFWTGTTLAFFQ